MHITRGERLVPALALGTAAAAVPAVTEWAFELDGILIVAAPVALDLAHTVQARPLAGDLNACELVQAEEVFLGSHIRAITLRLARKDTYTEQHTRRVALRAVQVGDRLGLSRGRLRTLAIGGLVAVTA